MSGLALFRLPALAAFVSLAIIAHVRSIESVRALAPLLSPSQPIWLYINKTGRTHFQCTLAPRTGLFRAANCTRPVRGATNPVHDRGFLCISENQLAGGTVSILSDTWTGSKNVADIRSPYRDGLSSTFPPGRMCRGKCARRKCSLSCDRVCPFDF